MRTRSYLYLAVADARLDHPVEAKENFRRMIQLDQGFLPGLLLYTSFIVTSPKNIADIPDLELLRSALKGIIDSSPESASEQSIDEHNAEAKRAAGLLQNVERRLNELQMMQ